METERCIDVWVDRSIRRAPGSVGGRPGHAGASFVFKMEEGVWVPSSWAGKEYALGIEDNSEKVELIAIQRALGYVANRLWRTNGLFCDAAKVRCDCKRALDAISQGRINDPSYGAEVQQVLAYKHWFESGAVQHPVIFQWCPRGSEEGNVMTDGMATSASAASELGAAGTVWDVGTPDDYPAYH